MSGREELSPGKIFKKMKQFKKHANKHYELTEMDLGYTMTKSTIRELGFFDVKDYDSSILGISPFVLLRFIVEYFYRPDTPSSVYIEELWRTDKQDIYIEFINQSEDGDEGTFRVFVNGYEDTVVTKVIPGDTLPRLWKISMADGRKVHHKEPNSLIDYVDADYEEEPPEHILTNEEREASRKKFNEYIKVKKELYDKYVAAYGLNDYIDYLLLNGRLGSHLAFQSYLPAEYFDAMTNNDVKTIPIEEDFKNHLGTYELYLNGKKLAVVTCIVTDIDYEDKSVQSHLERID